MPQFFNSEGLIINRKNQREGDLLITIFTKDLGKISCIAKGVSQIRSRRLGHLQIGNQVRVKLFFKNNLYWLSEADNLDTFFKKNRRLSQINFAFSFLEIVNFLLPKDQVLPDLYPIILTALNALKDDHFPLFINQEIALFKHLGFGLPLIIQTSFDQKNYPEAQKQIQNFAESIIEKPLHSRQLFR